jgi:hypothetical protein
MAVGGWLAGRWREAAGARRWGGARRVVLWAYGLWRADCVLWSRRAGVGLGEPAGGWPCGWSGGRLPALGVAEMGGGPFSGRMRCGGQMAGWVIHLVLAGGCRRRALGWWAVLWA